jgi:PAS domain S-box-containing protein
VQRYIDELALLQAIRLAVVATDVHGTITFANESAAELYGGTPASLRGRDLMTFAAGPDGEGDARKVFARVLRGSTWRGDARVRRLDGSTFLAGISGTPVHDAAGEVTGTVVVSEDLTEIRRVEAENRAQEQRLRLAYRAAQLGYWHWDIGSGRNVWDEQLEAIYGLAPGGFTGTYEHWASLLHPEDREHVRRTVREALAARSTYVCRHRVVWPDGTVRWVEGLGQVTVDAHGEPTGTVGVSQDVTDRVLAEQAAAEALAAERASTQRAEALAVERATLAHRVTEISEQLQSSLAASPLPCVPGVEIAARYSPGGDELEHVGGDWYDVVDTDDGALSIVLGDVMGRGVQAATTMIWVRGGIRGLVTVDPTPAFVLGAADRLLTRDAPDQFVTAVVAVLDPAARRLTLSSAGHVPVLVVHGDGHVDRLGVGSGTPLGVGCAERVTETHHLPPGATVVLVTDGVVEGRAWDLDQGVDRLAERASYRRHLPLDELVEELSRLADPCVADDVTVVAARLG